MLDPALDVHDLAAAVALVPMAVERLGGGAELHDQIAGEVLRLDLAALFPPEPDQGGLVPSHDDPGVGAADEGAAVCPHSRFHFLLQNCILIGASNRKSVWVINNPYGFIVKI